MKKSKLFALMTLGAVLFAGTTVGFATAAHATPVFPVGYQYTYKIVNVNSGKVMDVDGSSSYNGGQLDQWDYLGIPSQKWVVRPTGDGVTYWITGASSGMNVENTEYGDGGRLQQSFQYTVPQQKWLINPVGDSYIIKNLQTGNVIDVEFNKTDNGWHLHSWHYISGVQSQLWKFVQI
ncbi:RICIN domain-containing protein [Tumebacillus sp. ITR2]|uniref:RICIN domain-containing protein n=1 Tax=Tumebacillus amylolyticus TaxID=2801339 RepID=A0ABS1J4L4_9BACL|nr:RICIN domain-containing protein [Tumebacillus amylolyticus]MBL0385125.1 RICIN domain-containing protein [Tumebacillus amylolyticus]